MNFLCCVTIDKIWNKPWQLFVNNQCSVGYKVALSLGIGRVFGCNNTLSFLYVFLLSDLEFDKFLANRDIKSLRHGFQPRV